MAQNWMSRGYAGERGPLRTGSVSGSSPRVLVWRLKRHLHFFLCSFHAGYDGVLVYKQSLGSRQQVSVAPARRSV